VENAKKAANALDLVDLNNLTNEIVDMYETLQKIRNSFTREYSKEEYTKFIDLDPDLED
jgi:hypothetical protein